MTLTTEQRIKLVDNYVNHIIDGLDTESIEIMVFDLLTREYESFTDGQILGEIKEIYGDEVVADLLEVSNVQQDTLKATAAVPVA
jgi:hypothetical protein